MRWFQELVNPALRCERLGHKYRKQETAVYLYPSTDWRRGVADEATETTEVCRCCGDRSETIVTARLTLQGLGMASDRWDILRRDGRLIQR